MENNSELIVNGYCFGTAEDAEIARQEVKKIEYLERHMDYENSDNMFLIYKKAIDSHVFQTPIGWEYLKELRRRINSFDEVDKFKGKLPPITMYTSFVSRIGTERGTSDFAGKTKDMADKGKMKNGFIISIIINIILVISIGAMFAIAMTSNKPNIINYEDSIINKYSMWEQELTDREKAVKEKERELGFTK